MSASENSAQSLHPTADNSGQRLDQYLTATLGKISRARVQELIDEGKVLVDQRPAKPSYKLRGDETITIAGTVERPSLRAIPEAIPLEIVYEDEALAVINKPAGMSVHAGSGSEQHNRGTLVNALLHHLSALSSAGGSLRPGIVHRLDKDTSGLIVVAKTDEAHRALAVQFAGRSVAKKYLTLVHGWPKKDTRTIESKISRDRKQRTRMTASSKTGRTAITHYRVTRKFDSAYGKFALLEVQIETGRTHQIRVHLSSIGHPVVGDALYGASRSLKAGAGKRKTGMRQEIAAPRNFLHAAEIEFSHPGSGKRLHFVTPLASELQKFRDQLE